MTDELWLYKTLFRRDHGVEPNRQECIDFLLQEHPPEPKESKTAYHKRLNAAYNTDNWNTAERLARKPAFVEDNPLSKLISEEALQYLLKEVFFLKGKRDTAIFMLRRNLGPVVVDGVEYDRKYTLEELTPVFGLTVERIRQIEHEVALVAQRALLRYMGLDPYSHEHLLTPPPARYLA